MFGPVSTSDVLVAAISAVGAVLATVLPPALERQRRLTAAAPTGGPSSTRLGRRMWVLVAFMSLLIAILSARQIYQALNRGPVEARVLTPTAGENIKGNKYAGLEAYIKNIPEGFEPTISVYDPGSKKYNPSDKLCTVRKNGRLDCPVVYIGKDDPFASKFTLQIVAIDKQAQGAFSNYNSTAVERHYPGLVTLPAGTLILKEVSVTRTQ
ncbi:hypothetical protein GCM10022223_32590 [Kineosporia mesophila]|uniref:Uncharacterized protein n=1 Tax=Kineosporia mesophila TaxID=566012 RepID=A0ABP6ZMX4_9ACTN|nr:hypothetical protein [Kineosporia mesophila]MCD5353741.1 hypothetical protein [Kineosporia mesophila]